MPNYMTQKMSSGRLKAITYYRKQTIAHPDHTETEQFTADAKSHYADERGVAMGTIEEGKFKSGQGVPTGGEVVKI